ncbi:MAG: hypothetical protein ABW215_03320 [Kibdelosporangium sp.]
MNDGFRSEHESLARHAGDFAGLVDRAGSIAGELTGLLDSLGRSWGADEVGQSFSAVYNGPSAETRKGADAMSGQLDDMRTRLTTMAAAYRDVDESTADGLGRHGH